MNYLLFSLVALIFSVFMNYNISFCIHKLQSCVTLNSEIFVRILFLGIALKDIYATFKICDLDMVYLHQ